MSTIHTFRSKVVSAAQAAVAEGEHQWGLQLLDMILDSEVKQDLCVTVLCTSFISRPARRRRRW